MDTFVLRVWTPAPGTAAAGSTPDGTHGTAQHVASGRSGIFRSEAQLIRLLAQLRDEAAAEVDGGRADDDGPLAR